MQRILASLVLLVLATEALTISAEARDERAVFSDCGVSNPHFWSYWNGDSFPGPSGETVSASVSNRESYDTFREIVVGRIPDLDLGETQPTGADPVKLPVGFVTMRFSEASANLVRCLDKEVAVAAESTSDSGLMNGNASLSLGSALGLGGEANSLEPPVPDPTKSVALIGAYQDLILGTADADGEEIPGICGVVSDLTDFSSWTTAQVDEFRRSCARRAEQESIAAEALVKTRITALYAADRMYIVEWWVEWLEVAMRKMTQDLALIKNSLTALDFLLPGKFVKVPAGVASKLTQCEG